MSIIKNVTLQKIVAHDFRYDPRIITDVQKKFTRGRQHSLHCLYGVIQGERLIIWELTLLIIMSRMCG